MLDTLKGIRENADYPHTFVKGVSIYYLLYGAGTLIFGITLAVADAGLAGITGFLGFLHGVNIDPVALQLNAERSVRAAEGGTFIGVIFGIMGLAFIAMGLRFRAYEWRKRTITLTILWFLFYIGYIAINNVNVFNDPYFFRPTGIGFTPITLLLIGVNIWIAILLIFDEKIKVEFRARESVATQWRKSEQEEARETDLKW